MPYNYIDEVYPSTSWTDPDITYDENPNYVKLTYLLDKAQVLKHSNGRWRHFWSFDRTDVGQHAYPTSAHTTLWGDTFARTEPTRFWLMDDGRGQGRLRTRTYTARNENEFNGGQTLTKHGDPKCLVNYQNPLAGEYVVRLNGDDAYYEENDTLLTDDAFMIGGWFRCDSLGIDDVLFHYGNSGTDGRYVQVGMNSDNQIIVTYQDGGTATFTDQVIPNSNIRDQEWHYVGLLVDRNQSNVYVFITDGTYRLRTTHVIALPNQVSFNTANSRFVLAGDWDGTTLTPSFVGDISNVKIFTWDNNVDHKVIPLEFAGIRDNPNKGVTITERQDMGKRHHSVFRMDGDEGDYAYALVNLDEGHYRALFNYHLQPDGGGFEIFFDNLNYGWLNTYWSSEANDVVGLIDQIYFQRGYHFVKIKLGPKDASSTGYQLDFSKILIWKTDGSPESYGSSALLLGDEFIEKTANIRERYRTSLPFYNGLGQISSPANKDYASGHIYMSAGAYSMTTMLGTGVNYGIVKFYVNGKLVRSTDCYTNAGVGPVNRDTFFVRLEEGRNEIKIEVDGKNDSSTGYQFHMGMIRLEKVGGWAQGDDVSIYGHDLDYEITEGTSSILYVYNNLAKFGAVQRTTDADSEFRYKRWFSGGLYEIDLSYLVGSNNGSLHIEVGGQDAITVGQTSTSSQHASANRLALIPRGYHYIDISSLTGSRVEFSHINFRNISHMDMDGDEIDDHDIEGRVLIAEKTLGQSTQTFDVELGHLYPLDYDRIYLEVLGIVDESSTRVAMRINDMTGNVYKQAGYRKRHGATFEEFSHSVDYMDMVSGYSIDSGTRYFEAKMDFAFYEANGLFRISGGGEAVTGQVSMETWRGMINLDIENIYSLIVSAVGTGGYFREGTRLRLFGQRNKV